jgi:hypothetical protein
MSLTRIRTGLTALSLSLALAGCGGKKEAPPTAEAKPTTAEPTKNDSKPLTAAWFGTVATPPAPLVAVQPGTLVAEARKLAPDHFVESLDVEGVRAQWKASSDGTKVESLFVSFPLAHAGLVTEAWGPGVAVTRGPNKKTVWLDPAAGMRAELSTSGDKANLDLRFESYLPVSKLLGEGAQIAFFDKPVLGVPLSDVKKSYAAYLDGEDLQLPATDFQVNASAVRFEPAEGDAPVTSYTFEIEYKSNPAFKDELLALFEKKWGKPKAAPPPASDTSIYNAANPHVEIGVDRGRFVVTVTEK